MGFSPDYFIDRAKKWLGLAERAKREGDPKLAQSFAERARLLTQTAANAERFLGLKEQSERVVSSKAKTLGELRRELGDLSAGTSLRLPTRDYWNMFSSPDEINEAWSASRRLGEEFKCAAEFRPEGQTWFVKRG